MEQPTPKNLEDDTAMMFTRRLCPEGHSFDLLMSLKVGFGFYLRGRILIYIFGAYGVCVRVNRQASIWGWWDTNLEINNKLEEKPQRFGFLFFFNCLAYVRIK